MIKKQGLHSDHRKIALLWNSEFIDAPYKLGGMSKEEGYDCVSMIYCLLFRLGMNIDIHWGKKVNITNYWYGYKLWLLPKLLRNMGEIVSIDHRKAGDILLCYFRNANQWGGVIYLGNEICGIVNGEIGKVGTCPFRLISPWIVEARRCHNYS